MDFLYLSEEDMIKAGVLDMPACIVTMEDTFKLLYQGDYRLGGINNSDHGLRTRFPKESDIPDMPLDAPGRWFTAMPAYLGGKYHCFGFKTYGANQNNPHIGLPRSVLMMQLLDASTGVPLAFMSANLLSAMRTGAVTGLYAKLFAKKDSEKIAIIGPGVIGRYSLDGVMAVIPSIQKIAAFGRGKNNRNAFIDYCHEKEYPTVTDCTTIDEACQDADIIVTASSQAERFSDYPLIKSKYLKEGTCVITTSAVRIERNIIDSGKCTFVADDIRMYMNERGIDAIPLTEEDKQTVTLKNALHEKLARHDNILNLPELVSDTCFCKQENHIYLCASGGIPIEDVSWAYMCYRKAINTGIGMRLPIWNTSHL